MFNFYNSPDIKFKGFSSKTNEYCNKCIKELLSSGINTNYSLCYLINKDGLFYLYSDSQELGFLTKENDGTDVNFKMFINSAYNDIGDFYCIALPCSAEWYPFSNRIIAFTTKESFDDISKTIERGY